MEIRLVSIRSTVYEHSNAPTNVRSAMRQLLDSTSTSAGEATRRHVTFAPTALADLPTRPSRRQSNRGRGNRGGRAGRAGAVSTTGAASSTVNSGSGGSGSNGSDSANGSSGATGSSYSRIIEDPAPAAGANHDPSLATPCPVAGSIHPMWWFPGPARSIRFPGFSPWNFPSIQIQFLESSHLSILHFPYDS